MMSGRDISVATMRVLRLPAVSIFLFVLISLVAFQYFQVKIYDFPSKQPFRGSVLYNPYDYRDSLWLKANFHSHSKSWFGVTNGHQSGDDVVRTYQDHGYDVASLSDYHRINNSVYAPGNIAIPVYEHGMNISKQHHLAIGAEDVTFEDVFLWQNNDVKQFLLERMSYNAPIVCLNHPGLRGGHREAEIGKLTGYNSLEVLNNEHTYTAHWDSVLSAGRPVWILANDDSHDVERENIVISWNLIQTSQRTQQSVLEAMKRGSSVGVRRRIHIPDLDSLRDWALKNKGDILKEVITKDSLVTFIFTHNVNKATLIGQSGKVVASDTNTDSIIYAFKPEDTYVRLEADFGALRIYLNPIMRHDGMTIPQNLKLAAVNFSKTFILRISIILLYLSMLRFLFPTFVRRLLYGQHRKTYPTYEQTIS